MNHDSDAGCYRPRQNAVELRGTGRRIVSVTILSLLLMLAGSPGTANAQSASGSSSGPAAAGSPATPSILETERDTLKFGIDSEVLDLVKSLTANADARLAPEVFADFKRTYDEGLKVAIINYFNAVDYQDAESSIRDILTNEDSPTNLVIAGVQYFSQTVHAPSSDSLDALEGLFESDDQSIASEAIRAFGAIVSGTHTDSVAAANRDTATKARVLPAGYDLSKAAQKLQDVVENGTASIDVQGSAILALGDLRAKGSEKLLAAIMADRTANSTLRQYSANTLGKIGDPAVVPALTELLSSDDTFLRAQVIAALGRYPGKDTNSVMEQALRDSFWRVRQAALESIGDNGLMDALPAVIYKAEHDPDQRVRLTAIATLGTLGTADSWNVLRAVFENGSADFPFRTAALEQMLKNDAVDSLPSIEKVINTEWAVKDSKILDATCKALSTFDAPSAYAALYGKLLIHPNFIIRIYGLRGVAKNNLQSYRATVEKLADPATAPGVLRQAAADALERLGGAGSSPNQ